MRAPTAVEPDLSSPEATSGIFRSFSSSSRKPRNMPRLIPSSVTVKYCKPGDILLLIWDSDHRAVSILHLDPPSLHRGEAIADASPHPGLIVFLCLGFI